MSEMGKRSYLLCMLSMYVWVAIVAERYSHKLCTVCLALCLLQEFAIFTVNLVGLPSVGTQL